MKLDEPIKKIYFNRRYRALINSRSVFQEKFSRYNLKLFIFSEILLDDLSQSISDDQQNRILKMRAICVLDEELIHLQDEFSLKSLEEQASIRLHQIRAMINVFLKQTSQFSFEDNLFFIPLIESCDSFISTFRLFLDIPTSDISFNSFSDIFKNE